ncbi:MAG: hypothetical protein ACFB50_16755 [Rubrobacteraceae bacterium]
MQEVCYCGRSGDIQDRFPALYSERKRTLEGFNCGHTNYLDWLPEEISFLLWKKRSAGVKCRLTSDVLLLNLSTECSEGGQIGYVEPA